MCIRDRGEISREIIRSHTNEIQVLMENRTPSRSPDYVGQEIVSPPSRLALRGRMLFGDDLKTQHSLWRLSSQRIDPAPRMLQHEGVNMREVSKEVSVEKNADKNNGLMQANSNIKSLGGVQDEYRKTSLVKQIEGRRSNSGEPLGSVIHKLLGLDKEA
eukprot:TRINITY_DN7839_c0_g1_i2.p1 TRINITY_DN7839_c0_g1~~TRINITY_DN7839_c0_g1_i2.p1  ORF type:complete len:159 (+),score=4.35 TRINITY_DN7839_c0_g1_i2:65-541(+)